MISFMLYLKKAFEVILNEKAVVNLWESFYPEDAPKDVEGIFEGSKYWVRYKDKKVSIMLNLKQ